MGDRDSVIFDLDGTLADNRGRRFLLGSVRCDYCEGTGMGLLRADEVCPLCAGTGYTPGADFSDYMATSVDDPPVEFVAELFKVYRHFGFGIFLFTARDDAFRDDTVGWLVRHGLVPDVLEMRRHGDTTPDPELKRRWLYKHMLADRTLCAFEDRIAVAEMYRDEGVPCVLVMLPHG